MKKSSNAVPTTMPEEKPSARIRLGTKMDFPNLSIGKTVSVTLTGKIVSLSDESWDRGFSMQITSVEKDGMGEEMGKSRRSRSMMEDFDDLDED